jgi:hypothetical protein
MEGAQGGVASTVSCLGPTGQVAEQTVFSHRTTVAGEVVLRALLPRLVGHAIRDEAATLFDGCSAASALCGCRSCQTAEKIEASSRQWDHPWREVNALR